MLTVFLKYDPNPQDNTNNNIVVKGESTGKNFFTRITNKLLREFLKKIDPSSKQLTKSEIFEDLDRNIKKYLGLSQWTERDLRDWAKRYVKNKDYFSKVKIKGLIKKTKMEPYSIENVFLHILWEAITYKTPDLYFENSDDLKPLTGELREKILNKMTKKCIDLLEILFYRASLTRPKKPLGTINDSLGEPVNLMARELNE